MTTTQLDLKNQIHLQEARDLTRSGEVKTLVGQRRKEMKSIYILKNLLRRLKSWILKFQVAWKRLIRREKPTKSKLMLSRRV